VSQARAALDTTTLNNSAASAARHALHKAVYAWAVALLWLIGSFWHTGFYFTTNGGQKQVVLPIHSECIYMFCLLLGENNNVYPLILASFPLLAKHFPQFFRWDPKLGITFCIKNKSVVLLQKGVEKCGKLRYIRDINKQSWGMKRVCSKTPCGKQY
jgi:hypothetical protein